MRTTNGPTSRHLKGDRRHGGNTLYLELMYQPWFRRNRRELEPLVGRALARAPAELDRQFRRKAVAQAILSAYLLDQPSHVDLGRLASRFPVKPEKRA